MGFCSDGSCVDVSANFKSADLPVPQIIAIGVLGGGCEPLILGKRRPQGVGDGTEFLHSKFSPIFKRFRDIAAFVLQHATFSNPTSSLLQISPCSPASRWIAFGLRRANVLG